MDWVRLGLGLRAIRRKRGWTQAEAASRAKVSQSAVSRAERGEAGSLSGATLVRIAQALGARYVPRLLWQGEALDRVLDAAHAGLVEDVIQLLVANGWEVVPEATFSRFGERGSIDVLAWHPEHGALLVVEVKSVVPDMQALLAGVDRKVRIAPQLAADRGWQVRSVSRLLVLPGDRTARRRVVEHAATFDLAFRREPPSSDAGWGALELRCRASSSCHPVRGRLLVTASGAQALRIDGERNRCPTRSRRTRPVPQRVAIRAVSS